MRGIRIEARPAVLFGAMLVAALILFLPLRLVLGWVGLSDLGLAARSVEGSVWSGRLDEAQLGGAPIGDVGARVAPLPLMVGRARVDLSGRGDTPLDGALTVSRHSVGIDDVTAGVTSGAALAPLPIARLDLDDVSARFVDGACDQADGRVRATLSGGIGAIALPQAMSGTARCDGAALLLPLTDTAGADSIALRLRQDGSYTATMTIRPADPAAAATLAQNGFVQTSAGFVLSVVGG